MKVFVTGHQGYIGAHLVALLKEAGHSVTGCDLGFFVDDAWGPLVSPDVTLCRDVRDITVSDLAGFDCVMHLAAISNDPMGELDASLTYAVNREGTTRLAKLAKKAGVARFLFAGSCSIYGKVGTAPLDESAAMQPLSAYARSKVEAEEALKGLTDAHFSCISLRNATAFGASPMLRLDLVANNLLASAFVLDEIRVMSDGTPWRPLVHCKDIARAFIAFMSVPLQTPFLAVNIGANEENYQVKDVAEAVRRLIPDAKVVFTGEVGADPRSYQVNFNLLKRVLPDFSLQYSLKTGLEELYREFVQHGFTKDDFLGDQFFRLRSLKKQPRAFTTEHNEKE
jgi:nucleoside-diphosphate-sugar epimerase